MKTIIALSIILKFSFSVYAQKSNFGAGINLGVSVPAGDFDEFYNTGFGVYAHFIYHLGNAHIYDDHIQPLSEQIKKEPFDFPTFSIKKRERESIEDYKMEDFELHDYKSHSQIKMEMRK